MDLSNLGSLNPTATQEELAENIKIPVCSINDDHFEYLFLEKFSSYDDVITFVATLQESAQITFFDFMNYWDTEIIPKGGILSRTMDKRQWACSALSSIRRTCGSYKTGTFYKR